MNGAGVIVMAKAPTAGRAKTRLCPPCTPAQAADIAGAALTDTLETVRHVRTAAFRVLALDGAPGPWLPAGFDVIDQRGNGLDERVAAALVDVGRPALVIGMDTPHLTPAVLDGALSRLAAWDAVLGPAADGGWWALGLRYPDPAAVLGVPMSAAYTCDAQRRRLGSLGLRWSPLDVYRDVDTFADALAVSRLVPGSHFAAAVQRTVRRQTA